MRHRCWVVSLSFIWGVLMLLSAPCFPADIEELVHSATEAIARDLDQPAMAKVTNDGMVVPTDERSRYLAMREEAVRLGEKALPYLDHLESHGLTWRERAVGAAWAVRIRDASAFEAWDGIGLPGRGPARVPIMDADRVAALYIREGTPIIPFLAERLAMPEYTLGFQWDGRNFAPLDTKKQLAAGARKADTLHRAGAAVALGGLVRLQKPEMTADETALILGQISEDLRYDPLVRAAAAQGIAGTGAATAVDRFLEILATVPPGEAGRYDAIMGLASSDDARAIQKLTELAVSDDPQWMLAMLGLYEKGTGTVLELFEQWRADEPEGMTEKQREFLDKLVGKLKAELSGSRQ